MYRPASRSLALRVALLVALLVFTGSACGGRISKPQLLPEERRELRSGVYRSEEFKPLFSFRVGEHWTNVPPETSDALLLEREGPLRLGFVNANEALVYNPNKRNVPQAVEAPADMVGWFLHHPYLETSEPEPVHVGGVKGLRFDAVAEEVPKGYDGACGSECVDLFKSSDAPPIGIRKEDKVRIIVLEDVKGERVTMGFAAPATEFDEYAPEAQEVVDSVEWGGS
jgi:hypothetical protein